MNKPDQPPGFGEPRVTRPMIKLPDGRLLYPQCCDCLSYEEHADVTLGAFCHNNAPRALGPGEPLITRWPPVEPGDWCRKFEPRPDVTRMGEP